MTESQEQIEVFRWAATMAQQYPALVWMHHIPNGGSRGDTAATRGIRGARLAAEGVRKGVADIFLPAPGTGGCGGLYIEMKSKEKKPKTEKSKGGLSDEQIKFAQFVTANGFSWHCCYGAEDAIKIIKEYLAID
jgi:hypothetical protein